MDWKIMSDIPFEERVKNAFSARDIEPTELVVRADPNGGWMVRAVAKAFEDWSETQRRQILEEADLGGQITWRQLLTPEEVPDAAPMPSSEPSTLPLWPDSLSRGEVQIPGQKPVVFLSDAEEELSTPITATFYSLRGGVGRSTALAHTARLLAEDNLRVVCLDMDLEAPGLAALFGVEGKVKSDKGIVHLLLELDQGGKPDLSSHLIPLDRNDNLFLIPAGLPSANYATDLSLLDPDAWYRESSNPLRALFECVRTELPFSPDVVLIDSRTGISALSAPLLFEQADLAVVVMFPHEQAHQGTKVLVQALMRAPNRREMTYEGSTCAPDIRMLISPLPETEQLWTHFQNRAYEWLAEWLEPAQQARRDNDLPELIEGEISHFVPYREAIAASSTVMDVRDIKTIYGPVADWVQGLLPARETPDSPSTREWSKIAVLDSLRVDTGTAEDQGDFKDTFIQTAMIQRALDPQYPLVLGRKGTGKTALFRYMTQVQEEPSVDVLPVMAAQGLQTRNKGLLLGEQVFRSIDNALIAHGHLRWKQFWMLLVLLQAHSLEYVEPSIFTELGVEAALPIDGLSLVQWLEELSATQHFGLKLEQVFSRVTRERPTPLLALWDGLDTGFGNQAEDRERRSEALRHLMSMVLEWEKQGQIRFKILLREDIWRDLRFENKSHLFGRAVTLQWAEQNSFLKVAIKQLWRSEKFVELVKGRFPDHQAQLDASMETWKDELVERVWNLVAGERMSGGKTAFTRNWVWKRLADANNDRAPRNLLQLVGKAIEREKKQQQQSQYFRSLIRPNSLIKVLPDVSEQALAAILEEFGELDPVTKALKGIGRTPFQASDLTSTDGDLISLAREVGLLGIHEGEEGRIERYRVPEIYRLALDMTRKGQA